MSDAGRDPSHDDRTDPIRSRSAPSALAWITLAATFAVLLAGAQVNAYQAALSVATWPLSYGRLLLADWAGNTFYEQLHRLAVGLTTLLYLGLTWSVARSGDRRALRLVVLGLAALAAQVLLGGVVVLWLDPPLVAALHLLLAIGVVAVTARLVAHLATTERGDVPTPADPTYEARNLRRARRLLALIVLQLLLGALSRHPPFGATAFIGILLAHLANGLLIVALSLALGISIARRGPARGDRRLGGCLILLALLQLGIGAWVFLISPEPLNPQWPPPVGFPAAHLLHVAIATLLTLAVMMLARKRRGRGRGSTTASEFRGTPS